MFLPMSNVFCDPFFPQLNLEKVIRRLDEISRIPIEERDAKNKLPKKEGSK